MKTQINALINQYGLKLFSRHVKKDLNLWKWVLDNSDPLTHKLTSSEIIYSALNNETKKCLNGSEKKFSGFKNGYKGCGRASNCKCVRDSVSIKVKKTKSEIDSKTQLKINNKRIRTNLKKYGVINTGQTQKALNAHKEYYEKLPKKVKLVKKGLLYHSYNKLVSKFKNNSIEFVTSLDNYIGVSNQTYYKFKCLICNTEFSDYIDNGKLPRCKICHPYIPAYISNQEKIEVLEGTPVNFPIESGHE